MSHSMRSAWIEIAKNGQREVSTYSRTPCGVRGLKLAD